MSQSSAEELELKEDHDTTKNLHRTYRSLVHQLSSAVLYRGHSSERLCDQNKSWLAHTVSDSEPEADLRQWTGAGRVTWMRPVSVLAPSWCFKTHPKLKCQIHQIWFPESSSLILLSSLSFSHDMTGIGRVLDTDTTALLRCQDEKHRPSASRRKL